MRMVSMVFLLICTTLFLDGCSLFQTSTGQSVGCSVETVVTTATAGAIAAADSCSNVTQIQTDIQNALGSINLCQAASVQAQVAAMKKKHISDGKFQGPIGDIVCPLAADAINGLINNLPPASWGCTGNASVSAAIAAACVAAVGI